MTLEEHIREAYKTAIGYPDLVMKLITLGVQSYTVEVTTGTIIYRFGGGQHVLNLEKEIKRNVATEFSYGLTVQAVKDTQQGKTGYPAFMNDIAKAGVRFYEATFTGNMRVTYIGAGGFYEELIPV